MRKIDVYDMNGTVVEEIELDDNTFGIEEEYDIVSVIHNVVNCQIKRMKRKTSRTKTRAEVSGGGIKPYRQKGTGRARQGSIRSPQFRGGGIVFGPRGKAEEEKNVRIPRKIKRLAMRAVLSSKVANEQMIVLDKLEFDNVKTKNMIAVLNNLKIENSAIIMMNEHNQVVGLSARNIPSIKVLGLNNINILDMLKYDKIIITKDAVRKLEEVYA